MISERSSEIREAKMNIRFYIDPFTEQPHIYNHNVDEIEVEDILGNPGEDRSGSRGSRIALGQTRNGRYLRVIYIPDPEPDSIFVITAYEFSGKPLTAYRRRKRKRGK
jgi:hypothetical protein